MAVGVPDSSEPLDLSTAAWGLDAVQCLGGSSSVTTRPTAVCRTGVLDNQPLATLVDLDLAGCDSLRERLDSLVARFATAWLAQDIGRWGSLFLAWQMDNFGLVGTGSLLTQVGISPTTVSFAQRALERVRAEEAGRHGDWREKRFFFKDRVYCYAEFALELPGRNPSRLCGSLLKENSYAGTRAGRTGLLRSIPLPINELVDRTLCAEFQLLSELCDLVGGAGLCGQQALSSVTGLVQLWTTGASCLSCVGVFRQFNHIFTATKLQVTCAKRLG